MGALAIDLGIPRVGVIANKVRDGRELEAVRQFSDRNELDLVGVVPYDDALPDAERAQRAPLDHAPDAPAIRAIGDLAERLVV